MFFYCVNVFVYESNHVYKQYISVLCVCGGGGGGGGVTTVFLSVIYIINKTEDRYNADFIIHLSANYNYVYILQFIGIILVVIFRIELHSTLKITKLFSLKRKCI